MTPIYEQGYLIPAFNTDSVDYVDCARQLAKSLRAQHPSVKICLLTNDKNAVDHNLFDHTQIIEDINTANPYANDWRCFFSSPFRETIKLEADMFIASPIEHWWDMFRHRDVVISTGCRDYYGNESTNRSYRKIIDENGLPDVYNAITYWRLSKTARDFFIQVRDIFDNWDSYKRLIKFPETVPSTDIVYAMAAQLIGPELVTMPFTSYPKIVHMKREHIGTKTHNWTQELVWEQDPVRIQTVAQWGAVHYNVKDWRDDS